jgi:hypothetical protein
MYGERREIFGVESSLILRTGFPGKPLELVAERVARPEDEEEETEIIPLNNDIK